MVFDNCFIGRDFGKVLCYVFFHLLNRLWFNILWQVGSVYVAQDYVCTDHGYGTICLISPINICFMLTALWSDRYQIVVEAKTCLSFLMCLKLSR